MFKGVWCGGGCACGVGGLALPSGASLGIHCPKKPSPHPKSVWGGVGGGEA